MTTTCKRYYLLDLLKFSCLLAIQTLHAWEFVFYEDPFLLQDYSVIYEFMTNFARSFSIGGQVLVAIIYFLFGFTAKDSAALLKIAGFALCGQVALTLAFMDESGFFNNFEWDIYLFIAFSNLAIALLPKKMVSSLWSLIVCLVFLFIPTSFWQTSFPEGILFDVLSGRKGLDNSGAWAVFPWFFHTLLFYRLGVFTRNNPKKISNWHHWENYLWGVGLLISLPAIGAYFHTPIGPNYYVFNFNQSPYIYWANFLPFLLWMRVSLIQKLQDKVQDNQFLKWISGLMWVRHVGATYLIAILYVGIGAEFDKEMRETPYLFDAFYVSIMPVCEILARIAFLIKNKAPFKGP